jgi:hypothetical protein
MEKFLLSERYRLELHWQKAIYEQEGICKLESAYFSGPVLSHANKINCNDHILIDFYSQYVLLVKSVFVAKLSWKDVIYNTNDTISLKDVLIEHDAELNNVPQLKDTDYLVVDTSDHEESIHALHMVYKTYVVNDDGKEYNFGS